MVETSRYAFRQAVKCSRPIQDRSLMPYGVQWASQGRSQRLVDHAALHETDNIY